MNGPLLLRPKQAAKEAGIGRTLFYELIKAGHVPTVEIDGQTKIRKTDLQRFIETLPVTNQGLTRS